ncbi:hydroxyacid dehydrogenase [Blastococcus saxobsidens]|uniref:hydroxyacid dehydrogenase n=1 Tax=Blastococcus saxobsidens TaxID=138336 RepID=UPI001A93257A|nr:hydroxyacid dehydrogenase [Blastococcus saxobsidens]
MTGELVRPRLVYFERWVDPVAEEILGHRDDVELLRLEYADPLSANWAAMAGAHGYHVQPRTELRGPWFGDSDLLARSPRLLALASTGAGYDYIDVDACTSAGVIVCHQGGTNREAVAEHALGLMLALSKRIAITDRALRRGEPIDRFELRANDIAGKTLGIVGLGAIGSRVAELCAGLFGMRVLAFDPYVDAATARDRHAEKVNLDNLLQQADVVSVHCPRTSETMGMLGAEQFALMRPTAYFVSTARGGVHDEEALAGALRDGRIAGAGVDVFLTEPPPADHPLLQLDSVIATPHIAGVTVEALREMASEAARQWMAVFAGRVPPRLVNPEAWPRYSRRFEEQLGFAPDPL